MNKNEYLDCCQEQLLKIFSLAKNHKKDDKKKFRVEGFIHAGKVLGVISHLEAVDVIARAHFQVFGESIESRQIPESELKRSCCQR